MSATELESRVVARALAELPAVAPVFPKDPVNLYLNDRTGRGVRFFVGQKEARETIRFARIVAIGAYTRTQPPQWYLVREEQKGTADFFIFANEVEILIDAKPEFPRWRSTVRELADAYNSEQEEKRRQEAARPSGTSSVFRTKRSLPGQASEDYLTKREAHLYAVAEQRDYLGIPGELVAFRNRCVEPGYPLECYGELIFRVFEGDIATQIEARARLVRGADEVLLQVKYHGLRNLGLPDRILHTEHVDAMMKTLARILLEELGEPVARETPPPEVPPPPVVVDPEPAPAVDTVPPPPTEPPRSGPTIAERIGEMDALFTGAEDMLQGTLLLLSVVTQAIEQQQEQSRSLVRALESTGLSEHEKAPIRAKLRELAQSIRTLTEERAQLEKEAREAMHQLVEKVRGMYRDGEWGNSDFNAYVRVLAAEERGELFEGQLMLAGNQFDRLLAYAAKMQEAEAGTSTRKNGLYLESLVHLRHGRLIDALGLFRTVRHGGYVTKGTKFEEMEAMAEVEILKAMQEQTVASRLGFHEEFEQWLGQHADIGTRDPNATWTDLSYWQDRKDWWVDGSTWMSWYRTVQGAMGALPAGLAGETEAEGRAREVGEVHDSMALKHVGLGMVIGLRKKGFSLAAIQAMDTEQFREACRRAWERDIPPAEARQKLQAIRAAFELEDLRRLSSDEVLVEGDLRLSADLVERIELDDAGFRAADWAGWFGDMTMTPGNVVMMFAPMAKFSLAVKLPGAAAELKTVHTLAEVFQASRPYTWAVRRLSQTRLGSVLLEGAAASNQFAQQGMLQAGSVFVTEVSLQMGASFTVGQTLGPEAQFFFDMFVSLGGADVRTLGSTVEKLGLRRGHFQHFAMRTRSAATRALREIDEAGRLSQAIRKAVDEGAPPETLRALRRELEAIPDLPPEFSTKLAGAIRQADAGAGRDAVRQTLDDLDNLRATRTGQARNARQLANEFEDVANTLQDGAGPTRRADGRNALAEVDPHTPLADAPGPDPMPPNKGRFDPESPLPLERLGDQRSIRSRWTEAADAYEALLARGGIDEAAANGIRAKRDMARRLARLEAAAKTRAGDVVEEFTDELERQVKEAIEAGRYAPVPSEPTSASSPRAILDEQGRTIAYFKQAEMHLYGDAFPGASVIREGEAEVLASSLQQALGRPGPAARVIDGLEIDGVAQRIVATKVFPDGEPLGKHLTRLARHPRADGADWVVPKILAHKQEIAEDIAIAMVLGDGDRHLSNLWLGRNGRCMGYDYGLADFLPDHAGYRNRALWDLDVRNARQNLDDLLRRAESSTGMNEQALMNAANPDAELRHWQERVTKAREVFASKIEEASARAHSIYRVADQPAPPDFRTDPEGFKEYTRKLMERHWSHGTRDWVRETGDLLQSSIRFEDVAPLVAKLRQLRESGDIATMVRESLAQMAEEEVRFATRMVETRIDILEEFLRGKFRSLPDTVSLRRAPRSIVPFAPPSGPIESVWRIAA